MKPEDFDRAVVTYDSLQDRLLLTCYREGEARTLALPTTTAYGLLGYVAKAIDAKETAHRHEVSKLAPPAVDDDTELDAYRVPTKAPPPVTAEWGVLPPVSDPHRDYDFDHELNKITCRDVTGLGKR
jgi:hypothetical protein